MRDPCALAKQKVHSQSSPQPWGPAAAVEAESRRTGRWVCRFKENCSGQLGKAPQCPDSTALSSTLGLSPARQGWNAEKAVVGTTLAKLGMGSLGRGGLQANSFGPGL